MTKILKLFMIWYTLLTFNSSIGGKAFWITLLAVLLNTQCVISQGIRIIDKLTLLPVEGSHVQVSGDPAVKIADKNGFVNIAEIHHGSLLHISHIGFRTEAVKFIYSDDYQVVKLESYYFDIAEVEVSVSRFTRSARDETGQVIQIKKTDILHSGAQTAADMLNSSGAIFVQKSQAGGGSPVIRGFEANKVLIVVDGIRMNNAIYRGGHLHNVISVDPLSIEKNEVLFGPGSILYGSDALGGVINFFTMNPVLSSDDKMRLSFSIFSQYQSVNSGIKNHFGLNIGSKKLASLTSLSFSKYGDLTQGSKRKTDFPDFGKQLFTVRQFENKDSMVIVSEHDVLHPTAYNQLDLMQKLLFRTSEKLTHTLNLQFAQSSEIPFYGRLTELTSAGKPRWAAWNYGPQYRFLAAYHLDFYGPVCLYNKGKLALAYQKVNESRHTRRFNSMLLGSRKEEVTVLSLNADFEKKLNKLLIQYGTEISGNEVHSKADTEHILTGVKGPFQTRYPDGGSHTFSGAAYLQSRHHLGKKLLLIEGIRYSYYSLDASFNDTTFFKFPFSNLNLQNHEISGSVGLGYPISKNTGMSAQAASGFRSPNVDDIGKVFDSSPGNVIIPNVDLNAERTITLETGLRKWGRLSGGLFVYKTFIVDAITTVQGKYNGQDSVLFNGAMAKVISLDNTRKASIQGVSIHTGYSPIKQITLYGSIQYTIGRIETDTSPYPLDHIPPLYGKSGLNGKWKNFTADIHVNFNGKKKLTDYNLIGEDNFVFATADGMPSWKTISFSLGWKPKSWLDLQLRADNVADVHYRAFSSTISAGGRNFGITLRTQF